jgi:hypothetical protein
MKCSDSWWMDAHICFLCLKSDSSGGISDDSIIHSWTSKSPFNRDMPNVDATDGIQNFCVQIQNLLNVSIRMMYRSSWSMEVKFLKYDQNTNMAGWCVTSGISNFDGQIQNLLKNLVRMIYRSPWLVKVKFFWNVAEILIQLWQVPQTKSENFDWIFRISSKCWSGWHIGHPNWWMSEMWLKH